MQCPLNNFAECPEHNKKGGCAFWMSYNSNSKSVDAKAEGCAVVLTPMLLIQQINNTAVLCSEMNKVGAEVSAGRVENIRTGEAARQQLILLASGKHELVRPDYTSTTNIKGIEE